MAAPSSIVKNFNSFRGLDLRSSDLVRTADFATEFQNAQMTVSTSIENRRGFKGLLSSKAKFGLAKYAKVNTITGQIENELIAISDTIHRKKDSTFEITYTGAQLSVLFEMKLDKTTNKFKAKILDDGVFVLDLDLGVGIDEASPVTLTALKTAIDALADYSATITGTASLAAAVVLPTTETSFTTAAALSITFNEWEAINTAKATPLAGNETNKNAADFENTSWINLNGNLYLTNGYDDPLKYDGQTVYRVGMPDGVAPTTVLGAGTGITDTGTKYSNTYLQKDNVGNIVEGKESAAATALAPTNKDVDVTVTNLAATTGFNTNAALVAGTQSGVTVITVDNGAGADHTLNVGDTAYFFDGVTSKFVERNITARSTTSITIAGAAVDVVDNKPISNNLRIPIYRTTASGIARFIVAEIPNDPFNTTQVYNDSNNTLGAQFLPPLITPSPPPKGRYVTAFQNLLVLSGNPVAVNTVYVPDPVCIEGFDVVKRSFIIGSGVGDRISGLGTNNQVLLIGKEESIFILSGDLSQFLVRVDQISSGGIGVKSHHSIKDIGGVLYFLSIDGARATVGGRNPTEISSAIQPIFISDTEDTGASFNLKRATAIHDSKNKKYLLFLPNEFTAISQITADDASRVVAYDYLRNSWARYDGINAMSGFVDLGNEIWFAQREHGATTNAIINHAFKLSSGDTIDDYADHEKAINFKWAGSWESFGDPSIFKKAIRLKIHSLDPVPNDGFTLLTKVNTDFDKNAVVSSKNMQLGTSSVGYGLGPWGLFPWGSTGTVIFNLPLKIKTNKARSFRAETTHSTVLEKVSISGYEWQIATPYKASVGFKE